MKFKKRFPYGRLTSRGEHNMKFEINLLETPEIYSHFVLAVRPDTKVDECLAEMPNGGIALVRRCSLFAQAIAV